MFQLNSKSLGVLLKFNYLTQGYLFMCLRSSQPGLVQLRNSSFFPILSFIGVNNVSFSLYCLFTGSFYVWWLSDVKEVLLEMLTYVSKVLAMVQLNKEVFHCYRIIIPHLWPRMCVYYKDLRLRKTSESSVPAPDLIMLPFTICWF